MLASLREPRSGAVSRTGDQPAVSQGTFLFTAPDKHARCSQPYDGPVEGEAGLGNAELTVEFSESELPAQLVPELQLDILAGELRIVLSRLIRRLRNEHRFPLTQAAVLGVLERDGPRSIGELATQESVRPQSMSQTICELETEGLIKRRPDPSDGRRTQIALTAFGHVALEADRAAREGWLARKIAGFTPEEQQILRDAVDLLNRVADAG